MFMTEELRQESAALLARVEENIHIPAADQHIALHRLHALGLIAAMRKFKPARTLEVGLGWGYSAACIQAAGSTDHTIVSRDHDAERQRQGMINAMVYGTPRVYLGASDLVLPTLVQEEPESFDLILIDGGHRFDDAFVDLHYALKLCANGGVILIDDTWMPSIRTVCAWLESNRSNVEVLAHYECLYMYKKCGSDQRAWTHWVPFEVATA